LSFCADFFKDDDDHEEEDDDEEERRPALLLSSSFWNPPLVFRYPDAANAMNIATPNSSIFFIVLDDWFGYDENVIADDDNDDFFVVKDMEGVK